jgi:hypothetical protein
VLGLLRGLPPDTMYEGVEQSGKLPTPVLAWGSNKKTPQGARCGGGAYWPSTSMRVEHDGVWHIL